MPSLIKERRRRVRHASVIPAPQTPTPERLFGAVCEIMDLSRDAVRSMSRHARLAKARAIYSYLGREMRFTSVELAKVMDRDHAVVLWHTKKYTDYLDSSKPWFRPDLKTEIENIKHRLKAKLIYCS